MGPSEAGVAGKCRVIAGMLPSTPWNQPYPRAGVRSRQPRRVQQKPPTRRRPAAPTKFAAAHIGASAPKGLHRLGCVQHVITFSRPLMVVFPHTTSRPKIRERCEIDLFAGATSGHAGQPGPQGGKRSSGRGVRGWTGEPSKTSLKVRLKRSDPRAVTLPRLGAACPLPLDLAEGQVMRQRRPSRRLFVRSA